MNKISRKTMSRTNVLSKRSYDHKTTPANSRFYQRGRRRAFLGSRHQKGPYFDRRPFTSHSPTIKHQGHERSRLTQVSFPNHVNNFVAGRLRQHISKWRELTSDPWVLATVSGCPLEFARQPVQSVLPKSPPFNQAEIQLIDTEVEELLLKRTVHGWPLARRSLFRIYF